MTVEQDSPQYEAPPTTSRSGSPPVPPGRPRVLPQPPNDREKYAYTERRLWLVASCSFLSVACLTLSQIGLVRSTPWLLGYLPLLVFTLLYFALGLYVNLGTRDFDLDAHRHLVEPWRPDIYPSVAVLLPVCGEPADVLHNTWTHVRELVDRRPDRVHAYVLDDSGDPQLAEMARHFGFTYTARPDRGRYKKAGNLHHGLSLSDEEYVLILDADFAPRPDMLDELLPYLEADPQAGIVQSPQYFRVDARQTWMERGAGSVQEFFYRVVQTSRQDHDGAICVGTCALYRRAALDANGGTTLIEHSEDVHTGFDLRRLGWSLRYVPVVLAAGTCQDEVDAFYRQQYRWCMGSMSILTSRKFWATKLRSSTRICYLSGFFYYVHTALFTFAAPLLALALVFVMPEKLRAVNSLLVLPSLVYGLVIFPHWQRSPLLRLDPWAARLLYGWAHAFALWDLLRHRPMGWQPTGATTLRRTGIRRLWTGVYLWSGGTAAAWVAGALWRILTMHPADFALILFSGLFYTAIVSRTIIPARRPNRPC
jgi:cellulose synthase/poly-beta-1,6-N-acetylglucosamine synthase-like glycosyltransferase